MHLPGQFIDSHCHLDLLTQSAHDHILQSAKRAGVSSMIIPGLTPQQWPIIAALSERYSLFFTVGLHPWWLQPYLITNAYLKHGFALLQDQLVSWLQHPRCVGIGECGLDGVIATDLTIQSQCLVAHLEVANQYQKPIVLHSRKTDHLLLQALKQQPLSTPAFTGHVATAEQCIKAKLLLGIGGTITYPRARKTRNTVQLIGLEHLVLETDSPDMPLHGFQGQVNHPSQLPAVAHCLATLRQTSLAQVALTTRQSTLNLFNLSSFLK